MRLIGICGGAGVGKSTAASMLVKEFGFVEVALADPIKRICKEVFDFTDEQLWGPSENRNKPDERYPLGGNGIGFLSPRYALQTLGTDWGRACYENIWVDIAIRTAIRLSTPDETDSPLWGWVYAADCGLFKGPLDCIYKGVVISDVRFRNEVDAIEKAGGSVWRINRPSAKLEGAAGAHASEAGVALGEGVHEINNTGTLEEFRSMVMGIMSRSDG